MASRVLTATYMSLNALDPRTRPRFPYPDEIAPPAPRPARREDDFLQPPRARLALDEPRQLPNGPARLARNQGGSQMGGRAGLAATERATRAALEAKADAGPSVQDVLDGKLVMHGKVKGGAATKGEGVREVQQMLRDAGYDVPDTGVYDAKTEAAVREFQKSRGLNVNGHVNRETAQALKDKKAEVKDDTKEAGAIKEVDVPATRGMTEAEKYDYYEKQLKDAGVEVDTGENEKNVLCLRRESSPDARGGKGEYDDVMVIMWVDEDGNKRVKELPVTTEPTERYDGKDGDDVNDDGLKDQGRLAAGYSDRFQIEEHARLGTVLRPDHSTDVERDPQHDGSFDGPESSAGRSVLIHQGGRNATGSAGCITLPPDEFEVFIGHMRDDPDGSIPVTVIDMPA